MQVSSIWASLCGWFGFTRRFEMEYTKAGVLAEINIVLDNEIMTAEQLLDELMGAMTNVELKENWDYIKQNWDLEEFV